jgi:hypothetical protein
MQKPSKRKLVIPAVLAVAVIATTGAVLTSCGGGTSKPDAALTDAAPDTPIV